MKTFTLAAAAAAMLLTGCESITPSEQRGLISTAAGALVGGVAGHQLNHKNGRYVGAVVGALAGMAINNYMSQQQQQLQQQLQSSNVNVKRVNESTIELDIQSEVLFGVNQAQISANFYQPLDRIAQILRQYPNTIVHVYGFTDRSGNPQYNQQLSQRRANNVAQYLIAQGVNPQRFVVYGYGEKFATAQNNPADRRVSIYIKAINENNPQAARNLIY